MTRESAPKRIRPIRAATLEEALVRAERIMSDHPGAGIDVRVLAHEPGHRRLREVARLIAAGAHDYRSTLAFAFQDREVLGNEGRITLRPVRTVEAYGEANLLQAAADWEGPVEFAPAYQRLPAPHGGWVALRPQDRADVLRAARSGSPLGIHRVIRA